MKNACQMDVPGSVDQHLECSRMQGLRFCLFIFCVSLLICPEAHAEFSAPVIRKIKEFYQSASAIIFICGCVSLFWGITKLMLDSRADVKWPITVAIVLMILGAFDTVVRTIGVAGW